MKNEQFCVKPDVLQNREHVEHTEFWVGDMENHTATEIGCCVKMGIATWTSLYVIVVVPQELVSCINFENSSVIIVNVYNYRLVNKRVCRYYGGMWCIQGVALR